MAYSKQVHEYQKNSVNGASPVQLVVMMYDGALRFMEAGKRAIQARDLEKQNQYLQRAQRIVMELMATLDMERGGEISRNLLGLYTYVLTELVAANVEDRTPPLENAIRTMSELREGWVELERSMQRPAISAEARLAA